MRRFVALSGVGLVAATSIAGCGSSSSDDNGLSKAEFVHQANAICKKGSNEVELTATEMLPKRPTPQQTRLFARQTVIPTTEAEIRSLSALKPPKDEQEQVDAFLAAAREGIDKAKADPNTLTNRRTDPFAKTKQLAKGLGLTNCGE
jgi:hypothetical protein